MAFGSFVQSIGVDSGTSTSASLAFQGNLVGGNSVIVGVRFNDTPGTVGISDSIGHSFVPVRQQGGTVLIQWWYVSSVAAGADTVTITTTNPVTMNWIIAEYEGAILLGAENGTNGSSTAITSNNFTTSIANALIIGLGAVDGQRSFTAGSMFTEREEIEQRIALEDRVVASAGTYASTFTLSSTDVWTGVGGAFYVDPGLGGTLYGVTIGGSIAVSGGLLRLLDKVLNATITSSGLVGKFVIKSMDGGLGVMGLAGAVTSGFREYVTIGGVIGGGGGLAGSIAGSIVTGTGVIEGVMLSLRRRRR
jgi:hypothetical protein